MSHTSTQLANSQSGLSRTFGCIPDGSNAFTMYAKTPEQIAADEAIAAKNKAAAARKRAARVGKTRQQIAALALRTDEERQADIRAARLAKAVERKPMNNFNIPIGKSDMLGTSAQCRAKAGI